MRDAGEHVDGQLGFGARFEWGLQGLAHIAAGADVLVIIDVLSFTTAVDIAVARGAIVFPYSTEIQAAGRLDRRVERAWHGVLRAPGAATALARRVGAQMAVRRSAMSARNPFSLSPASMLQIEPGVRLVLSSPNGAALCVLAGASGLPVLAGCLRNAAAVAGAARRLGDVIAVVAAGERWPGPPSCLRVAFEDLVGAGAILSRLPARMWSPEAAAAVAAFHATRRQLKRRLLECASGRELKRRGFEEDVVLAAELNVSRAAPILVEGAFIGGGC